MRISDDMLRQSAEQARERWLDTLPRRDELPRAEVSKEFQRKMDRLLRRVGRAEAARKLLRAAGKIAAALLLFATVSFAMLMTVNAGFREKVLTTVKQVFREYTEYDYYGSQEEVSLPQLDLSALPEGLAVLSDEQPDEGSRMIHCENGTGNYLDIDLFVVPANGVMNSAVDTENAQVAEITASGRSITVISKNDWNILLWEEGSVVISISSNIEAAELIELIERIIIS